MVTKILIMKKIIILAILIFQSICAHADGIKYFEHVRALYQKGRYEEARQGFIVCKTVYSKELDVNNIEVWIKDCDAKIYKQKASIKAKREAELAEAKRRAEAVKLAEERKAYEAKQKERIEKKLLYVSSNAFIFDREYTGMHQAIKGYIAENSEQRFAEDSDKAYWCVYITANAYEFSSLPIGSDSNSKKVWYTSKVVAYIKVTNEITNETLYEGEIIQSDARNRSSIDYKHSAEKAYKLINEEIGNRILKQLK